MKIKNLNFIVLLFLGLSNIQAQEVIPSTGGEANGSGGSVSYTIGQVVYSTKTGTNGSSITEGVQQPYEISVITSIPEALDINLYVSVFPNPATEYLIVKVDSSTLLDIQSLQYKLYDINGKLLKIIKATGTETKIEISNLVFAKYFVTVTNNKREIKTFEIIKN